MLVGAKITITLNSLESAVEVQEAIRLRRDDLHRQAMDYKEDLKELNAVGTGDDAERIRELSEAEQDLYRKVGLLSDALLEF